MNVIVFLELIIMGTYFTLAAIITEKKLHKTISNGHVLQTHPISQYKALGVITDDNNKENIAIGETKAVIKRATEIAIHEQNVANASTVDQLKRKNANRNLLMSFQMNKDTDTLNNNEGFRRFLPFDVLCNAVGTQCL